MPSDPPKDATDGLVSNAEIERGRLLREFMQGKPAAFVPLAVAQRMLEDAGIPYVLLYRCDEARDHVVLSVTTTDSAVTAGAEIEGRYGWERMRHESRVQVDEDRWDFHGSVPGYRDRVYLRVGEGDQAVNVPIAPASAVAVREHGWTDESVYREVAVALRSADFIAAATAAESRRDETSKDTF